MNMFLEKFVEKDAFFISTSNPLHQLKNFQQIKFCSKLEQKSFELEFRIEGINKNNGKVHKMEEKVSVTKFFDSKGYMHQYAVSKWFNNVLASYNNKAD